MQPRLKNRFFDTVTFRLTLWFTIIFIVFGFIVFAATYFTIKHRLNSQIDENLIEKMMEMEILYNEGVSKAGNVVDCAVDLGIIKKSGSWFSYKDKKVAQGLVQTKEVLKSDKKLFTEIKKEVENSIYKS